LTPSTVKVPLTRVKRLSTSGWSTSSSCSALARMQASTLVHLGAPGLAVAADGFNQRGGPRLIGVEGHRPVLEAGLRQVPSPLVRLRHRPLAFGFGLLGQLARQGLAVLGGHAGQGRVAGGQRRIEQGLVAGQRWDRGAGSGRCSSA
jgi:hypothetical protein